MLTELFGFTVMVFEELDVAGFIVIVLFRARLVSGTSRASSLYVESNEGSLLKPGPLSRFCASFPPTASPRRPLNDPLRLRGAGFEGSGFPLGLGLGGKDSLSALLSSLAAAFLSDSSVCLIEPFLRRLGVAEGLGTSLRPTDGLFGASRFVGRWFPSISLVGDELANPFLLPSTGLAATFPFSSAVGKPNSFLLKLGLAWIFAILSDSSRSLLIDGRRVSDDVGSAVDFLNEPLLVKVEDPMLSASCSSFFFRMEGFLLRGSWGVGGMASTFSSSQFFRNDGRRAKPAAFAVA